MTASRLSSRKIGPLDCMEKPAAEGAPTIVCLHGYGADNQDLAPLADMGLAPEGTGWVFPNAPQQVPIGPGMMGRAWFPIDVQELEQAAMTGRHTDFASKVPGGFVEAGDQIEQLLQELGRPLSEIYLGGFSQGAMIACETALRQTTPPKGLILLSATLIAESRWRENIARLEGVPVFQSHGRQDPLLSFDEAERLRGILDQAGAKTDFHAFEGAHEIPPTVMQALAGFLKSNDS